jgi:CheY-like chemotaxis protein
MSGFYRVPKFSEIMKKNQPILFLEDDNLAAKTMTQILLNLKITNPLVHKPNGIEALNYLKDPESVMPGIILFDLNMPAMSGMEFLQRLKAHPELKKIPAIVLTVSKSQKDKMAAFSLGVVGYMLKPKSYNDYADIIQHIYKYWWTSESPLK